MRLLVFFDLPTETTEQKRNYRSFRKYLLDEGYLMLQESVYAKLVVNNGAAVAAIARLRRQRPPQGLVQVLKVTEKQFTTMVYITGSRGESEELDTMDELVIL